MRPKITCHMISSIDGRLLTERWTAPHSDAADDLIHRVYDEAATRLGGQGWMVGRSTMAHYLEERVPQPLDAPVERTPHKGECNGRRLAIVLDPLGKILHPSHELDDDHVVTILSERVEDAYLASLRDMGVSYLFSGADGSDLAGAMAAIGNMFGADSLLLQGGGKINGAFLAARLIDEFSTLIFPAIDGLAGIPSIVDYGGATTEQPAFGQHLELLASDVLEGDTVWLRHKVLREHVA